MMEKFLYEITLWGEKNSHLDSLLMVGSYTRDEAREDVDLIFLFKEPHNNSYVQNYSWLEEFGAIERVKKENWGMVQTLRIWFANGAEVEVGITCEKWAAIPVDPGTRRAVANGYRILVDKSKKLKQLTGAICNNKAPVS